MSRLATTVSIALIVIALPLMGACGYFAMSVGAHVYADHQLIDAARQADQERLRQAAQQLQQLQQQGVQAPAPAAAAPATPPPDVK